MLIIGIYITHGDRFPTHHYAWYGLFNWKDIWQLCWLNVIWLNVLPWIHISWISRQCASHTKIFWHIFVLSYVMKAQLTEFFTCFFNNIVQGKKDLFSRNLNSMASVVPLVKVLYNYLNKLFHHLVKTLWYAKIYNSKIHYTGKK